MSENNFSLSQKIAMILLEQGLTIAVAESCTGGGLAYQLTAVPGSADWFERGFVVYSNSAKTELLGVAPQAIETYGAVSEQVVLHMATGALLHSHADLVLSITGIAGPGGGSAEKPVGTVWFGFAARRGVPKAKQAFLVGGRKQIRHDAIGFALQWLLCELQS